MKSSIAVAVLLAQTTDAFSSSFVSQAPQRTISNSRTELRMGLFDGVKNAFAAPPIDRSNLDSERETPIDRWMGWSVTKQDATDDVQQVDSQAPANFVDSMDGANYVRVVLTKPMGIVFEENDEEVGGIFVQAVSEGGAADKSGEIKMGDQLVAVGSKKVSGMAFDEALGTIVDSDEDPIPLLIFRGTSNQFYGPTGASQAWLDEFITEKSTASN